MIFGSETGVQPRGTSPSRDDKPDSPSTSRDQLEDRGYGSTSIHRRVHRRARIDRRAGAIRAAGERSTGPAGPRASPTIAQRWPNCSRRSRKSLPRIRFRHRRSSASVDELITVTDDNRMICDPYPRLLVARDQVNQGAAALLMSVEAARRLGVPEEKWVYLHGHADLIEQTTARPRRPERQPCVGDGRAQKRLRVAGIGVDDVATFDLYSCFPFPVFTVCDGFGLGHRRSARAHAHRRTAVLRRPRQQLFAARHRRDCRAKCGRAPGQFGLVGANGGIMSKYSVGVYSTEPVDWRPTAATALQRGDRGVAEGAGHRNADGPATIETYSVRYDWPIRTGIIIGRLDADDQPVHGHHRGRGSGRADVRRRSARRRDQRVSRPSSGQPRDAGLLSPAGHPLPLDCETPRSLFASAFERLARASWRVESSNIRDDGVRADGGS